MVQTGNNCETPQHDFKRYFKGAEKPIKAIFWLVSLFKGKYGSTRKLHVDPYFTGRPVFLKYGSTRIFTGRPVYLRVDPYLRYGSTRKIRVDPYITGRPVNTSRPVKYGSTRKYTGRPAKIRVDPYYTGRPGKIRVDPYIYGSTRKNTGRPISEIRVDP